MGIRKSFIDGEYNVEVDENVIYYIDKLKYRRNEIYNNIIMLEKLLENVNDENVKNIIKDIKALLG